jgi:hypothetical protein
MEFTTAVGRKLAKTILGDWRSFQTVEEAELRRLVGDGILRADAELSRTASEATGLTNGDAARIRRVMDEIAFQTNILAIHTALGSAGSAPGPAA